MRFMMLMIPKGYENAEAGTMPDTKAVEAMMKYNEALQQAGVLLGLDGLHSPAAGDRCRKCRTCRWMCKKRPRASRKRKPAKRPAEAQLSINAGSHACTC